MASSHFWQDSIAKLKGSKITLLPMARWLYNRHSEKCDKTEIKVANKLRSMSPFTPTTLLTFHHHTEQSLRSIHEVAYMAFIDLHGRLLYLSSKDPASLYSVESYRGLVLGLCLGFLGWRGSSSGRRWGGVM